MFCKLINSNLISTFIIQPLISSRVNAINFNNRVQELEREANYKAKNGFSEEFEAIQQLDGKFLLDRKDF